MIKKNLFKTMTLIVLCTMVFAGCGRKKVTVDTSIQQESRAGDSKDDKKKVASNQEQVTVAVKDADGNTVEVAGIVETKDNGEKVVVVTDSDGNRTEISAGGFTSGDNKTITITDEKASETISSAAAENKVPKADEIIEIPDNGNNNNGSGNDGGNGSSGNSDGNGSSSGSNNGGSSSNGSGSGNNGSDNNGGNNSGNNNNNNNNSGNNNGSNGNTSTPDTPSHTHNWKPVYGSPIHHEAVTHDEDRWVVDKAAWDEKQVKYIEICLTCKAGFCERCKRLGITNFEYGSKEELHRHQKECQDDVLENGGDSYCYRSTYREEVSYIHHDEEGHYETVTIVDKEAWDEQVIDHYECDCGETK